MLKVIVDSLLGPLAGYFIAYLVRFVKRNRFWRKVEEHAKQVLEDDTIPITDPREAVERAVLDVQREPVERAARAVRASHPPASPSGRIPTLRAASHSEIERDPGKSG